LLFSFSLSSFLSSFSFLFQGGGGVGFAAAEHCGSQDRHMNTAKLISIQKSQSVGYSLWLQMVKDIPIWAASTGGSMAIIGFLALILLALVSQDERFLFNALESMKLKRKEIKQELDDCVYLEITIPKNSQATAFQIQQK